MFCYCFRLLKQSLAWQEEVGSPGEAGWLGREMLTLQGVLVRACKSVCDSGTNCVVLPRSGPITRREMISAIWPPAKTMVSVIPCSDAP